MEPWRGVVRLGSSLSLAARYGGQCTPPGSVAGRVDHRNVQNVRLIGPGRGRYDCAVQRD